MKIIVCVYNDMGMMFNHRRQSRDSVLCEYLLSQYGKEKIYMTEYSSKIFERKDSIIIKENVIENINSKDYFFIEDANIFDDMSKEDIDKIDEIIMCFWNRDYPSDRKFNLDISMYRLEKETDIAGNSHDKITIKEYRR